ncbi:MULTISPECIES: hypothetical protein [Novosphingobium]|uniref:hypothetical protein n=1 Tax=Novosphingobium TaxID=165696 RepID=UPI0022F25F94|nr:MULTISPECIES: hypothetical protein [Novosphingobium]GLK46161.1 hypothetical protein GCM10017612_40830 [Novosphingobium resinovorum]
MRTYLHLGLARRDAILAQLRREESVMPHAFEITYYAPPQTPKKVNGLFWIVGINAGLWAVIALGIWALS